MEPGRNKVRFSLCSPCPRFCRQSVGPPLENGLQPTTQAKRIKLAIVMPKAHAANVILSGYTSFLGVGVGVEEVFLGIRKTINRLDIRSCSNLAARQPTLCCTANQSLLKSFAPCDQVSIDSSKAQSCPGRFQKVGSHTGGGGDPLLGAQSVSGTACCAQKPLFSL